MVLLIVAPLFGVLTFCLVRQVDAAVAVSAAIFALASLLQGLVVWVQG